MPLLYVTLLAGSTFVWGLLFYKKEYHPQPKKVIIRSILAGFLAMIPVFGYRFIYLNHLPQLSEIEMVRVLLESNLLAGILFFLLNLLIIVVLLTVFTGMISLLATLFKHQTLLNIKKTLKEEEFELITLSMIIALLIYAEGWIEYLFNIQLINTIIGAILFISVIEEYVKHLTVRFVDDKKIKTVDDSITLSIIIGLSFAFIETMAQVVSVGSIGAVFPRAMLLIPTHAIASGIFGYYYGLARYADPILKAKHQSGKYRIRFKWIHSVLSLKKSTVFEEEKIAQGLVFAIIFHTGALVMLEINLAYLVVPMVAGGVLILSYFYEESHHLFRLIHEK